MKTLEQLPLTKEPVDFEKQKGFYLFGFRSKKWYKMLIASVYFLIMGLSLFTILFGHSEIHSATPTDILVERITSLIVWLSFIAPYLILSNIFNI